MEHSKVLLAVISGLLAVVAMAAAKSHRVPHNIRGSVKTTSAPGCVLWNHGFGFTAVTSAAGGFGATVRTGAAVGSRTIYLSKVDAAHCIVTLFTKGIASE